MAEVAADIRDLGSRKKEIRDACHAILAENLDTLLEQLRDGSGNRLCREIYERVAAENRRRYPSPEQEGVLDVANHYASGLIERMRDRVYLEMQNPDFIAFIREHGRFPKPGDLY